jgi:hypothetical protein
MSTLAGAARSPNTSSTNIVAAERKTSDRPQLKAEQSQARVISRPNSVGSPRFRRRESETSALSIYCAFGDRPTTMQVRGKGTTA